MFLKHRRQQVLAGVLLHVVEAARPIDKTFYFNAFEPAVNNVNDFLLAVAYLQNLRITNLSEVVRLTARSRIKGRLIQDCLPCGGLVSPGVRVGGGITTQDSSRKFSLEGVVVIKPACCHDSGVCGLIEASLLQACKAFCHASEYLYPVPVLNSTTVSCGLIHPDLARRRAPTTVAAPSGAAKIPSSDASSLPACSIWLSVTLTAVPLLSRSMLRINWSPSGPGTRNPEAMVAALGKNCAEL